MSITVKAPGKLYLAGEYSILTPGQSALILPVPLYLTATIAPAKSRRLFSEQIGQVATGPEDTRYQLIYQAIALAETYLLQMGWLKERCPFSLTISGQLGQAGKKFGLGSSGCVVVVTLKAVLAFYGVTVSSDLLFKLASATLLTLGDNGSMGDIACITTDQVTSYVSFDRQSVKQWLEEEAIAQVMTRDWGYEISPVASTFPATVLVGWTQKAASSQDLVDRVKGSQAPAFLQVMEKAVARLKEALEAGQKALAQSAIKQAGQALKDLDPAIYTPALDALVAQAQALDIAAKSSGAGGGDCGIALVFDTAQARALSQAWQTVGIETIAEINLGETYES
ncbi:phosphomevalonate kinase [Streptococcus sp. DD12]|uniref:phosphomevalonate kinase n=1 Tax=Streptococcus sp. DD12 TaxID=1777880 RepID=UPI00079AC9B8|nr:phosphomevalonate kinase [Streptococcus sp. DD12]KXT75780.1 Phosphomevalonate kinase [Streptococcus sp. DD12]